ncbi:MAG: sugar dehydrogenase [Pseudomonadota bacterium]
MDILRASAIGFMMAAMFSMVGGNLHAADAPLTYRTQALDVGLFSVQQATLPSGYTLELLTKKLDEPRLLHFAQNGDLFVGSKSGNVYRLPPPYTEPEVLVTLDNYPHSVALRAGEILIAQADGLYRAPYRLGQKTLKKDDVKRIALLPGGSGHNSRTVGVGPDGRVYVSLGITGNCSDEYLGTDYPFDDQRGGVLRLREGKDGLSWETFASGLRNPVGFDWHPKTHVLYASNNGPDHMGFDLPPEYFSRLTFGSFHGMPWFQYNGERIIRDDCIKSKPPRPIEEVQMPVATFPARNAPMGVAFVPDGAMDKRLWGDAIVALRGSWAVRSGGKLFGDKSTRRPPKIVVVRFKNGEPVRVDDLVSGFQLKNGDRWARPVGVAIGPDGALYFTSDSDTHGLFRLKPQSQKPSPPD